jgi:hypothetical protein
MCHNPTPALQQTGAYPMGLRAITRKPSCSACHAIFYRHRCLVCENAMRRKSERQRFGSGHKICQNEYQ